MEDRLSDDQREKVMAEYGDVEKFRKEAEEVIYEEDGKTGSREFVDVELVDLKDAFERDLFPQYF